MIYCTKINKLLFLLFEYIVKPIKKQNFVIAAKNNVFGRRNGFLL